MAILALDVGTSSVKAGVLAKDSGEPLGEVIDVGYSLQHPTPDASELDPEQLWNAVQEAAQRAIATVDGVQEVEGVGLAGLTPALVLLGEDDRPLGPIWTHLDRRARPVARQTFDAVGDEFLRQIGSRPLPGGTSAICFASWCQMDPSLPDRVRSYLHLNGWLGLCLTGERAFDPANASFSGVWGTLTDQQWSPRWCEQFGVDPSWLPTVMDGATTLGGLRTELAQQWGLKPGTPVKLGTADTSSALLACGATEEDRLHSVGTTQVLARLVTEPKPDPDRLTRHLGVGSSFVYVAHNPVGGAALDWLHGLCFSDQDEATFFGKTVPAAMERETTVVLDPPYLGGDRLEIDPSEAALRNLSLSTQRGDLLAAVLAAMQSGHREAVAALERDGPLTGTIFVTGGGADLVQKLLPGYRSDAVRVVDRASMRGVAKLFASE